MTELLQTGLDAEGMIRKVAKGLPVEILESHPVSFYCGCSRDKVAGMLCGLPKKDFEEILQDPQTEVHCQYCNKSYVFTQQELKDLPRKP